MAGKKQSGKSVQRTAMGHEIPVPKRKDFLRDLTKVAKGDKPSGPVRSPKKK